MIYLYDSAETDFRYNGKPLPTAYDVTVSNTLNSEYYVMGKYPLDKNKVYKEIVEDRILKVHTMDGMQPFRIVNMNKHETYVEFEAWPLFYADMRNKLVKPLNLKRVSGQTALNSFKNNLLIDTPFDFYSDITDNHDYHTQDENERESNPKQLYNALDVFKTIVSRWGGELWIRGYDIRVNKRIGTDTESMLYEKKNITEFVDTTNIEGIVTRLHGKSEWQDERQEGEEEGKKHLIETTVNSPLINNYSGVVFEKQYTNNDIRTEQELISWLKLKFTTENIDKPQRTIEVGTNVIDGTKIGFADTLILKYIKHDTDVRIKVVGYEYDGFANELKHVVLGQPKHTSSSTIGNTITDLVNNVVEPVDRKTTIAMNSADGKTTVFHGTADPNTLNLNAKENDTYFRTNGNEKEIWRFTGTLWELIMDTSETTKNADAIKEQQKDIEEAKQVADEAVEQIDTAVTNAGFTSLDETIRHVDSIANDAQNDAQQAITDAGNAFSAAQSALSGLDDKVDTSVYNATLLDLEADIDSAITVGNNAKETAEGLIIQVEDIATVANSALQEAEDAVGIANTAKTSADNLSTEVSGLRTDVEGFELTVNNYQDQVSQFSADVDGFQSTVASYETEVDEFGNIVSTNTTQLNELRNDIDGFESLLASYDEDLDGFNTTVSSFINTLEGLESSVASYETEVDEYGNEVATYATELSTLRNTVNGFESTVAEFDTTVTGYQTSLATLTNTVEGFESTVVNYETQVDEFGNEVSSYATEVATLENTVSGFNSLVASFEEEAEGYALEVSEFRNTVSGLQSTVASYELELDEYGNTVNSYATQVATFNNTLDGLESSVVEYEQSVSGYATQLATLTNTVDGFNSTVTSYETQLDEYGVEVDQYATQVSEFENTVSGFSNTVATFSDDVQGYETQVSTLTNTVNGFNSTVQSVESDYADLSGTVNTHTTELSNLDGRISTKAEQSAVDTLSGQVSTLGSDIDVVAGQISSKVWNTDIQTAIDGIEVGGRNYLRNSGFEKGTDFWHQSGGSTRRIDEDGYSGNGLRIVSSGTNTIVPRYSYTGNFYSGDSLTISVKVKTHSGDFSNMTGRFSGNVSIPFSYKKELKDGWELYVFTTELQRDYSFSGTVFGFYLALGEFTIDEVKLEKGNTATDWTPAPEDTDAKIEHIETEWTQTFDTFSQTVSGIDGRVTTNKQTLDGLETTIQSTQSDLSGTITLLNQTKQTVDSRTSVLAELRTDVDGKATTAQFNTLENTVNGSLQRIGDAEGRLTTVETNISGIQTTVSGKASQTQVTQLSNLLSSTVSDVEGNTTQTSQLANNINLRVEKDDVINQINISDENILIQSNRILLDGDVTVSGTAWLSGAVIANASIDGAKIQDATIGSAKIANLDANKITGDTTNFVRSGWDAAAGGSVRIDGSGIVSTADDGAQLLVNDGRIRIRNSAGSNLGSIGHLPTEGGAVTHYVRVVTSRGTSFGIHQVYDSNNNGKETFRLTIDSSRQATMNVNARIIMNREPIYFSDNTMQSHGMIARLDSTLRITGPQGGSSNSVAIYGGIGGTGVKIGYSLRTYSDGAIGNFMWADLNMSGNNVTHTSDVRLKKNIVYDEIDSLKAILNWKIAGFDWINPDYSKERQFGVIAQYTPEITVKDRDGYLSVNSTKQIQMNSHAIQQLYFEFDERVESNESKIHKMQQELSKANRRIEELEGAI